MANRPNKRIRQARAKKRSERMINDALRVAKAEAIPHVRSNVSLWSRSPAFGGVGYTSGGDSAAMGLYPSTMELGIDSGMTSVLQSLDPSLVAYNKLTNEQKLAIDKAKAIK